MAARPRFLHAMDGNRRPPIGRVLHALLELPRDVFDNDVIVFTSDHGEYAGAHGYLSGKVGSLYDEAYHVSLIVADPTRRFNGDIDTIRSGLTSTVDMLPLLVGLGHNGGREWLSGDLSALYGRRHDLLGMLRSARTPGRRYVPEVTDESSRVSTISISRRAISSECARRKRRSASMSIRSAIQTKSIRPVWRRSFTTIAPSAAGWNSKTIRPTRGGADALRSFKRGRSRRIARSVAVSLPTAASAVAKSISRFQSVHAELHAVRR